MSGYSYLYRISLLFILIVLLSGSNLTAQSQKVKERLDIIKKMKLMDALELYDASEEKMLQTYNDWENKIEKQNDKLKAAAKNLNNSLNKSISDNTIPQLTDE